MLPVCRRLNSGLLIESFDVMPAVGNQNYFQVETFIWAVNNDFNLKPQINY